MMTKKGKYQRNGRWDEGKTRMRRQKTAGVYEAENMKGGNKVGNKEREEEQTANIKRTE